MVWVRNYSFLVYLTFLARYYMDIADYSGGDKRDDISTLEINPIIHYMIPKDMDIPLTINLCHLSNYF